MRIDKTGELVFFGKTLSTTQSRKFQSIGMIVILKGNNFPTIW